MHPQFSPLVTIYGYDPNNAMLSKFIVDVLEGVPLTIYYPGQMTNESNGEIVVSCRSLPNGTIETVLDLLFAYGYQRPYYQPEREGSHGFINPSFVFFKK